MSAVYLVKTPYGKHIVKANTKSAAINFAVRSMVSAEPLTASNLADHLKDGLVIEDATVSMEQKAVAAGSVA